MLAPLHLSTYGDGSKTALLIHGLADSSQTWKPLAVHLSSYGYTSIAPDLSGHGKSPKVDKYSVDNWVNDITQLGIKPDVIIGHSLGGLVATKLQDFYKPQQTILLDPVFRLPKSLIGLSLVQKVFKKSMLDKLESLHINNISGTQEYENLRSWDSRTVEALVSDSKTVKKLFKGSHKTLLIRAKKSYISPRKLSKKSPLNIHLWEFPSSHTIHKDCFEMLTKLMDDFLHPDILV